MLSPPNPVSSSVEQDRRDEGVDLLDDERSLAGAGLYQARFMSHFTASRTVFREASYLSLSSSSVGSWLPRAERAGLDLLAQVLGDLPVHRIRHVTSKTYQPRQ